MWLEGKGRAYRINSHCDPVPFKALEEGTLAQFDIDEGPVRLLHGACA